MLAAVGVSLVATSATAAPTKQSQPARKSAKPAIVAAAQTRMVAKPSRAKSLVALPGRWAGNPAGLTALKPAPARSASAPVARSAMTASGGLESDEFNAPTLDPTRWRFVDPVGDATLALNGSQASISLPAGVSHDLWTGSLGAARLLQDVPNSDFEVEVKLDSAMGSGNQLQGIVVQQDADDLLRLEIHHDGNATRLFAAVIAGGIASSAHYSTIDSGSPSYLRVRRVGNQWTLRHSRDGTSWTSTASFSHAMTVTSVGPFVGNSGGSAPAFVGLVDHFRVISAPAPPTVDTAPPVIGSASTSVGSVAATVTWTTNEPATSEVAYGTTTAYGGSVSSTALKTSHRALLRLSCGTVYHFQIRSRDAAGNLGSTNDATFETDACSATIRADDFNGASLNSGIWTLVDPLGDASVAMSGTQAEIVLPAGAAHDVWSGMDTVTRLLQPVPNDNFEIEVKFDRPVTSAFQQQGLLVEQDASHLLRVELHHDGGATRLFAAAIAGDGASVLHWSTVPGGAPKLLRLKRAGNQWTVSHSGNGASWTTAATFTHAMTVRALGPLVGNGGSPPPAFTSAIDSFRQVLPDTSPPVVSAVSASPGTISATIGWTTNELASSTVAYGPTAAYELGTHSAGGAETGHSLLLHGLRCATTYHFQVRSVDLSGNAASGPDGTFTTTACPASLVSDEFNAATLDTNRWLLVDPLGDSTFTSTGSQARIAVPAGTRHDLWTGVDEVPRLLQATPDDDFEAEVKFDSPVTRRYQMQGLFVQQDARNLLRVELHYEGGGAYLFVAGISDGTASVIHQRAIAGGAPMYLRLKRKGSTWTLRYSNDGDSWTATSFSRTLAVSAVGPYAGNGGPSLPAFASTIDYFRYIPLDRTPPQVSAVSAAANAIGANVTWTTDEPSTSTVAFGTSSAYEGGEAGTGGETRDHSVLLHGLRCATTYHFQVRSEDSEGNTAASGDDTFTTAACPTELTGDEFNAATLNGDLWSFFNPLNDSTATANGSQAVIAVPAGVAHDLWTGLDTVPRLLQAAPAASFEVEAKFDSEVTQRYQQQGIVVEQDARDVLRIEVHSEWTETKLFVAAITDETASIKYNAVVPAGPTTYLRVKRVGDRWTVRYSVDGETWPVSFGFDQPFEPTAIGPFAGNGGSLPAFAANVDYFRVIPPPPPDLTPPALTSIAAVTHRTSATITWSTDELASSSVEWGATTAYGQPRIEAGELTAQRARLTNLSCATTYHYRVRSTDRVGNEAASADRTFTTAACAAGPSIVVWQGSPQTFGLIGLPQRWINVLGNVEDPNGIGSLAYRLNGGQSHALLIGPSDDRLAHAGDFNIELFYGDLRPGPNEVVITAVDTNGNSTARTVEVNWQGNTNTAPPANGPILALFAHPDDEALAASGILRSAKAAGRRVYVANVTNGDWGAAGTATGYCGTTSGTAAAAASYGLRRDREVTSAMGMLGLQWRPSLATTEIIYLGYPDGALDEIAASGTGWTGDATGLHRTYAEDFDGSNATCNGDFRYLLDGRHSELSAAALAADIEALLDLTRPSDIYTHVDFDGHSDHAKVGSSLAAALVRKGLNVRVHSALIHPVGSGDCQAHAAAVWPNPALVDNDPFARFTPSLDFTAPPTPTCAPQPTGSSWGPDGPPDELVEVPSAMQAANEADNLKWQAISRYESQIDCTSPGEYHVNCGYMRAFVKKRELFWTRLYSPLKEWPQSYTAHWSSADSASEQAQIFEGQWTYDGDGIRPVTTGFDRLIALGDMDWKDYEVTADMTFNSFDTSRPVVGSAIGLALGWQGHTAWGQPRFGHPSGGLCLYSYSAWDTLPFRVQLGYSPGPAHDTIVDWQYDDVPLGVQVTMRFRERELGNGSTRYSCKLWQSDKPEPAAWTVEADIADWENETGTHRGSVVLVAHHADVTFGDVTISPISG